MSMMVIQHKAPYVMYTPGKDEKSAEPQDQVLETWGITVNKKYERPIKYMMGWKRSGARKSGDHGFKGEKGQYSRFHKEAFDDMFAGWK